MDLEGKISIGGGQTAAVAMAPAPVNQQPIGVPLAGPPAFAGATPAPMVPNTINESVSDTIVTTPLSTVLTTPFFT